MSAERILIVDDSADIREFVSNYVLIPEGYQCTIANDGMEAFDIILSDPPDLIITDLQMPRMDGMELLYKMRQNNILLPVVLMTFHGSEELAIEVFRLGVRDYVIKPFKAEELLQAVERGLSEARLREERNRLVEELVIANRTLERRVQEMETVFEVGKALTQLPDADPFIAKVVDVAITLTHSRRANLLLLGDDEQTLIERASKQGRGEVVLHDRAVENKLALTAIQSASPIISEPFQDSVTQRAVVQVTAPVVIGFKAIGALNIYTTPIEEHEKHLKMLEHLANYAALGIRLAQFSMSSSASTQE